MLIRRTLAFNAASASAMSREAEAQGLLAPDAIVKLLQQELRRQRANEFFETADRLAALNIPPLSEAELETEIQAARAESLRP